MSKEEPENMQISSAQQFKQRREARDKGEVITLSSGLVVLVRRPEITRLIATGQIPNSIVQRFIELEKKGSDKIDASSLEDIMAYQREMVKYALLQPEIADEPDYDKNQISIDDLDETDLAEINQYITGGKEQLDLFRKERLSGVSA